jgi:hypothetical protein
MTIVIICNYHYHYHYHYYHNEGGGSFVHEHTTDILLSEAVCCVISHFYQVCILLACCASSWILPIVALIWLRLENSASGTPTLCLRSISVQTIQVYKYLLSLLLIAEVNFQLLL